MTAWWERFWFAPRSWAPFILLRAAFGVVVFLWAVSLVADATTLYGPDGVLAASPVHAGGWSLLDLWGTDFSALLIVSLLAAAGAALALGVAPRPAAIVIFAVLVSLGERNPAVGNSGDGLLRALSFYVLLGTLFGGRDRAWPLRLIQVQFSLLYIASVWAKLQGTTWPDGTAVAYAFRFEELERFPLPDIGSSMLLTHALTWGVLALELALGVLVWNRKLRPWLLLGGVCLHLGIEFGLRVGFFSWTILTLYLCWVPGAVAERLLARMPRIRSRSWLVSDSTP